MPDTKAQRIIFPARGKVELTDFSLAKPGADELLVRSDYSLMSIGTETTILHQRYDPDTHFAKMFSFPQLQTGVQAVGEVEAIGGSVSEFAVGDKVYLRMAHRSHTVIPAADCSKIPSTVDLKAACWCGLAKTAFRAAWAGRFELGSSVLIIGAGPVGQMAIRWAHSAGVQELAVVDTAKPRLLHAQRGGVMLAFPQSIAELDKELTSLGQGTGPGIVVDTTGNAEVFQHAQAAAARFGKVVILGDTGYPSHQRLSSHVMTKGLTIQATHDSHDVDGWTQRRIDSLFFDLLKRGHFDVSGLITHEFSPSECCEAYELVERERDNVMGVLFDWTK